VTLRQATEEPSTGGRGDEDSDSGSSANVISGIYSHWRSFVSRCRSFVSHWRSFVSRWRSFAFRCRSLRAAGETFRAAGVIIQAAIEGISSADEVVWAAFEGSGVVEEVTGTPVQPSDSSATVLSPIRRRQRPRSRRPLRSPAHSPGRRFGASSRLEAAMAPRSPVGKLRTDHPACIAPGRCSRRRRCSRALAPLRLAAPSRSGIGC
jgi:hypothetical protein